MNRRAQIVIVVILGLSIWGFILGPKLFRRFTEPKNFQYPNSAPAHSVEKEPKLLLAQDIPKLDNIPKPSKLYPKFYECVVTKKIIFPQMDIRKAFYTTDGKVVHADIENGALIFSLSKINEIGQMNLVVRKPSGNELVNSLEYFSSLCRCISNISQEKLNEDIISKFRKLIKKRSGNLDLFSAGGIYKIKLDKNSIILSLELIE